MNIHCNLPQQQASAKRRNADAEAYFASWPQARRLIGAFVIASLLVSGIRAAEPAARPNIVLLLADDLGYGELGCQGNKQIPTPHIDSLAESGVRFTQGYVTAPFCSASRAGLMTGQYQTRFGYEFNPIGHRNEDPTAGLPANRKTLASILKSRGYVTGLIGKWHLGAQSRNHPYRRGFDDFFGFLHEGHYFRPPPYADLTTMLRRKALPDGGQGRWIRRDQRMIFSTHMGYDEPAYDANNPILRGGQPVVEQAHLTDAFTREAVQFIDRNKDNPFFLFLSYNAVHSPLQATTETLKRHAGIQDIHRRIFAGMLSHLDDSVGVVLAKLRAEELEENTLVFFLSDNGGPTRELTSSNAPLRGEKGSVYEGGLRVPFLVKWPGVAKPGSVDQRPVSSLDIFATSLAVCGAKPPANQPMDGVDLRSFLTGSQELEPHKLLFWRTGPKTALRMGDWKLLRNPRRGQPLQWELYQLSNDMSEATDLATAEPKKLAELIRAWEQLDGQMMAPIWTPR